MKSAPRLTITICFWLWLTLGVWAQVPARPHQTLLADYPRVLPAATRTSMLESLERFRKRNSKSLVVVVVKRLRDFGFGDSIGAIADVWFDEWGLKPTDVLLLVSVGDRQARIKLGPAWPGSADAECRAIMNSVLVPAFKAGDWGGGLTRGGVALEKLMLSVNPIPSPPKDSPTPGVRRPLAVDGLPPAWAGWLFANSAFHWRTSALVLLLGLCWAGLAYSPLTQAWQPETRGLNLGLGIITMGAALFASIAWVLAGAVLVAGGLRLLNSSGTADTDSNCDEGWSDSSSRFRHSHHSGSSDSVASSSDYSSSGDSSSASSGDSGGATGSW